MDVLAALTCAGAGGIDVVSGIIAVIGIDGSEPDHFRSLSDQS
jgi:hypothetical protein